MNSANNRSSPTTRTGVLRKLRALAAAQPPESLIDTLAGTAAQARLLRALVDEDRDFIGAISELIPIVRIQLVDDLPSENATFWEHGHWHINIRSGVPSHVQEYIVLHELKRVIDHPLRRRITTLHDRDWEACAAHFALACTPQTVRNATSSSTRARDDAHQLSIHSERTGGTH